MRRLSSCLVAWLSLGACAHVGPGSAPEVPACKTIARCTLACDRGDLRSCSELASRLSMVSGVAGNMEKAGALWRKLCDGGDPDACKSLAGATELGNGVPFDKAKAKALYARAAKLWGTGCEAKIGDDCYSLAVLYRDGLGVPRDRARQLALKESACAFDAMQCRFVGFELRSGDPRRPEEELLRFERACTGGDSIACGEVAVMSKDPEAVKRAEERARELGRKDLDQDVARCATEEPTWCAAAAVAYREGNGVAKDDARADDFLARAVALYERACAPPDVECWDYAQMYVVGRATPEDSERATAIHERGCNLGNGFDCAGAARLLELSYSHGVERRNLDRALPAAADAEERQREQGQDDALLVELAERLAFARDGACRQYQDGDMCRAVGDMFRAGEGVPRDEKRAQESYARAARMLDVECEQELSGEACVDLSVQYRDGLGVEKDSAKAEELLQRACALTPYECQPK